MVCCALSWGWGGAAACVFGWAEAEGAGGAGEDSDLGFLVLAGLAGAVRSEVRVDPKVLASVGGRLRSIWSQQAVQDLLQDIRQATTH